MSAFHRQITVRFSDAKTTMSPHEIAFGCGLKPAEVVEAIDNLVAKGFLTPLADGTYAASTPSGARSGTAT